MCCAVHANAEGSVKSACPCAVQTAVHSAAQSAVVHSTLHSECIVQCIIQGIVQCLVQCIMQFIMQGIVCQAVSFLLFCRTCAPLQFLPGNISFPSSVIRCLPIMAIYRFWLICAYMFSLQALKIINNIQAKSIWALLIWFRFSWLVSWTVRFWQ